MLLPMIIILSKQDLGCSFNTQQGDGPVNSGDTVLNPARLRKNIGFRLASVHLVFPSPSAIMRFAISTLWGFRVTDAHD
jgi:hypothetical protein